MSDDLVNQITLNFLISKNQLQKLNKKMKEAVDSSRKTDRELYEDKIKILFADLLVDNPPSDLLEDVKHGFDLFVDKCIYYFKAKENNEILEKLRTDECACDEIICEDIDYEKEERDIENGNYTETQGAKDEYDDDEDKSPDWEVEECANEPHEVQETIQKLPLDWFQNVRKEYKKNHILPRTRDNK